MNCLNINEISSRILCAFTRARIISFAGNKRKEVSPHFSCTVTFTLCTLTYVLLLMREDVVKKFQVKKFKIQSSMHVMKFQID